MKPIKTTYKNHLHYGGMVYNINMHKDYLGGKMYKRLDYTITSVLVLTTLVAGALASSVRVGAEEITDVTDTGSVTVPGS